MVTRAIIRDDQIERYAEKLARKLNKPKEDIKMILSAMIEEHNNNKRQPKPPAPEGGICLRAAQRKYRIGNRTLSNWAKLGYLPIILRTKNELYIDETRLIQILESYKSLPDTKRRTIKKALDTLK